MALPVFAVYLPWCIHQDPSQRLLAMYSMSVLSETCAEVMKPVFAEFFPVFHREAVWPKIGFSGETSIWGQIY